MRALCGAGYDSPDTIDSEESSSEPLEANVEVKKAATIQVGSRRSSLHLLDVGLTQTMLIAKRLSCSLLGEPMRWFLEVASAFQASRAEQRFELEFQSRNSELYERKCWNWRAQSM